MVSITVPSPTLQIDFSLALVQIRETYLQDALFNTVEVLDLAELDRQLTTLVSQNSLKALARHGLRGELVFSTPYLLEKNPYLLGYYRLLLGISKKEFYTSKYGLSRFKLMEEKGVLTNKNIEYLPELCSSLIKSACELIDGIGVKRLGKEFLDDLTLLTVGPQLRGGANVKKGIRGIVQVFDAIHDIVQHAVVESSESKIVILNASSRKVVIEFAPDPDIVIREQVSSRNYLNKIAIEVKAGTDFSNIHNRVGEAEKSHQKAKAAGYVECWTVVNVECIDIEMAHKESPSTNRFYQIKDIVSGRGQDFFDFQARITSLVGITNS